MGVMPAGDGYYLVGADGGVFSYGSAKFYGSTGSLHLNKPVVGMSATLDGTGYWLVAADGDLHLNKPVVGMSATPDGTGYWLVAADGGASWSRFPTTGGPLLGSTGSIVPNKPIVGIAGYRCGGLRRPGGCGRSRGGGLPRTAPGAG